MILKKEIIKQLSNKLSLPFTGIEQDWDLEMADFSRIDNFLQFYKQNDLSSDEKIAIMALILASYEDYLNENNLKIDNRWDEIKSILKFEKIVLIDLLAYWALINEDKAESDLFRITPLIRNIHI